MTPQQRFDLNKDDRRYNTSYPLSPKDWEAYRQNLPLSFEDEKELSFYIHIPFCKSLCRFCEYVKYPIPEESIQLRYLDILQRDMDNFIASLPKEKHAHAPKAILRGFDIGGGTPTSLSPKALEKFLEIMNNYADKFQHGDDFVGSIEGSFSTIDLEKISIISSFGKHIGRISFGLQNINPVWLRSQNRDNSPITHIITTIDQCRKAGIGIINIDLMYGFQGQSRDSFDATLKLVERIKPEHLTLYELRTNMLHDKRCANAQQRFEQYQYLYDKIIAMGYSGRFGGNTFSLIGDDGVSSYLRNRMIPGGSYKGFGIAAQSKSKHGVSYNLGKRLLQLEECLSNGTFEKGGDVYQLPAKELAAKYIAICGYCGQFSLSILQNILSSEQSIQNTEKSEIQSTEAILMDIQEEPKNTSSNKDTYPKDFAEELKFLVDNGYLRIDGDLVTINPKGFRYYGAVLSLFYPENEKGVI